MSFRHYGVAATAVLAISSPALTPGAAQAQLSDTQTKEGRTIGSVDIKGIVNTNPDIVRSILTDSGLSEGKPYRDDATAAARKSILDKGLYSDVYIRSDLTPDRKVAITFEVFENPVVKLVRIKTSVPLPSKNAPSQEKILPTLLSQHGLVVNVNSVRADARTIQDLYRKAGYDAYLSEIQDVFDAKTGVLTFPVTITVINSIKVEGLHKTKPFVVLREMRTKPGDPLNRDQVQKDMTRVFATNLFSDVQNPKVDVVEEGRADLIIPVTEQRTGQVQVGFGYSAQQRLTGTLEIAENNFRGRGEGVSASWTVGGVVARSQFDLGFTQPWLDSHNTSLAIDLYDRIEYRFNRIFTSTLTNGASSNPYYEERRGGSVTLSRPVSTTTRVFTTLRTEQVTANNLFANYQSLTLDSLQSVQGSLIQDGNTSSIALRSLTNTRDNERDPANGAYISPSIEFGESRFHYQTPFLNPVYISPAKTPDATKILSTTTYNTGPFTKVNLDLRRYINISGSPRVNITDAKKVLATRLLLGTSTGNIGFSEQYFIGGADNLRGYADDRFWGNNLFLSSTELRIPMANKGDVTGVLFGDIGDAWGATSRNQEHIAGFEQHSGFSPHLGYGLGVRIRTPVGPVRLDYGIGETQRTHFSIGQAF
jgi:outer membrane protein insertion porin family